jgi:hypothetical protein
MGTQITRIEEKVEEQSGVPPQQQRLIFGWRQMCVVVFVSIKSPKLTVSFSAVIQVGQQDR